jgi:hypothetical protein
MNWNKIKSEVLKELNSSERNLANPIIRTNAMESLEVLLKDVILGHPQLLLQLDKESLLEGLAKLKKLNSAEKSIVNHVYNVLERKPIPMKKKRTQ